MLHALTFGHKALIIEGHPGALSILRIAGLAELISRSIAGLLIAFVLQDALHVARLVMLQVLGDVRAEYDERGAGSSSHNQTCVSNRHYKIVPDAGIARV